MCAATPYTVYGLLNDARELFYVGWTSRPPHLRLAHHRRFYRAVEQLELIVLMRCYSRRAARACERAIIAAISAHGEMLINDEHHCGRGQFVIRTKRAIRSAMHTGRTAAIPGLVAKLRAWERRTAERAGRPSRTQARS